MKKVLNRAVIRFEHFYNQPNKQISHLIVGPIYLFVRPLQYKYIIYQNEKPWDQTQPTKDEKKPAPQTREERTTYDFAQPSFFLSQPSFFDLKKTCGDKKNLVGIKRKPAHTQGNIMSRDKKHF